MHIEDYLSLANRGGMAEVGPRQKLLVKVEMSTLHPSIF